ncbi:hypothetical protein C8R48DRAFT_768883 [Suillus tomentosus]|nr:hypothetical protein C8R48DRAFT_768883 [Suillus tomentosus]
MREDYRLRAKTPATAPRHLPHDWAAATISPSWEPAMLSTYSSSYHFKPVRAAVSSTDTRESHFDLRVMRYSMLMDFLSHALVVIAPLPSPDASDVWWSQSTAPYRLANCKSHRVSPVLHADAGFHMDTLLSSN